MSEKDFLLEAEELIQKVKNAETDDFLTLLEIADLDPQQDLVGQNLTGLDLSSKEFSGFNFEGADLRKTNFYNANLSNVNLRAANLTEAILSNANLDGAILDEAILTDAKLEGTIFKNVSVNNVVGLTDEHKKILSKRFQLIEKYAVEILNEARKRFGERYILSLEQQINQSLSLKVNTNEVEDILEGKRSDYNLLNALCREFEIDEKKAIKSIDNSNLLTVDQKPHIDIDNSINEICKKITFPFERELRSFTTQPSDEWLKHSFIELDLCLVNFFPSQYPIFEKEELLRENEDDDLDRLGINPLYGEKINAREIIETNNENLFIYGDPGSGKSTFLKWIALECKDRCLLTEYLPIFLEVREFTVESNPAGLLHHLLATFQGWNVDPTDVLRIISAGRGLFILDGIDAQSKLSRARIIRLIKGLLINYDQCRFILSSRLGFDTDINFPTLQKAVLTPFHSNKQIPTFIRKWFDHTEGGEVKARNMLDKLKEPRYKGIGELSRRPVLLQMLCYLFEQYGDFPNKFTNVFRTGIEQLVQQSQFQIESEFENHPKLYRPDIINLLCRIASYFFIYSNGDILFHRLEVERIITEYYSREHPEIANTINPGIIIKAIEQYNGILVRRSSNFCSFSHLTYQEYFVAQHLVNENEQDLVYDYIDNPRWKFVIGLVAELLPQDKTYSFFEGFRYHLDRLINSNKSTTNFVQSITSTSSLAIRTGGASDHFLQVFTRACYVVYAFSLLKSYYDTIYLFSNCLNRSDINTDDYNKFINNMFLIENFSPEEEFPGSNDVYNFWLE